MFLDSGFCLNNTIDILKEEHQNILTIISGGVFDFDNGFELFKKILLDNSNSEFDILEKKTNNELNKLESYKKNKELKKIYVEPIEIEKTGVLCRIIEKNTKNTSNGIIKNINKNIEKKCVLSNEKISEKFNFIKLGSINPYTYHLLNEFINDKKNICPFYSKRLTYLNSAIDSHILLIIQLKDVTRFIKNIINIFQNNKKQYKI